MMKQFLWKAALIKTVCAGLGTWAMLGAGVHQARAAVVGMVISIKGAPMVIDTQSARRLRLSDRISSGDKIRCAASSSAVVVLFSGGKRFVVPPGKTAVVGASGISGARPESALSGASGRVAKELAGSKTGAFQGRKVGDKQVAGIKWSRLNPNFPGWMMENDRNLVWRKDAEAAEYSFTLINMQDDVVLNLRTPENSLEYPASAPAIELSRPYIWRLSFYRKDENDKLEKYSTAWGTVTWLPEKSVADLTGGIGDATTSALGKGDVTTALLAAAAFENRGVYQNALEILDTLNAQQPAVPGAFDALMSLYGRLPATARAYGPYQNQYAVWQFRTN